MKLFYSGWLLLASILAGPAQAQTEALQPRYAVEVIIFEHVDQSRSTQEVPVPPTLFGPGETANPRPGPMEDNPGEPLSFLLLDPRLGEPDFLSLAPGEKVLEPAYRRLERLDAYRPLVHLAWSQQAWPRDAAEALNLAETGLAPPGLSGQLTLYKERYVHLALDLKLGSTAASLGTATDAPRSSAGNARIVESRRLRGEDVQYFDNPRFGAIAQVWKLTAPEADTPPAADTADSTG